MEGFVIRLEQPQDYRAVEHLTREAFWNCHVPGCDEHYLARVLRDAACFLPELDFVAERGGRIVGSIMYTRAVVRCDGGETLPVLCFGPVSVLPEWQGKGVGSALIRHSLGAARAQGHAAVLIYGDPAYYARFGFVAAERFGIGTADGHYADALQAVELVAGALSGKAGRFAEDEAYEIDAEAARAFDSAFPYKEKRAGLPSQRRFEALVSMRRPRG